MPQKKHKPEEIVAKLRQVDVLLSQGRPVGDPHGRDGGLAPSAQATGGTGRSPGGLPQGRGAVARQSPQPAFSSASAWNSKLD